MPDLKTRIQSSVQSKRPEILEFLKRMIDINSFSRNYDGINQVGELVHQYMPGSLDHTVNTDRNGVNHQLYSTSVSKDDRNFVLVGHTDTVFPPGSEPENFNDSDGRLYGPGIADMKSGVAVIVYALRILEELNILGSVPIKCLINGDEEIGSPHSRPIIKELSKWASYGLVFEGGGLGGEVVHARRGIRRFKLTVTGEAHHAGVWKGPKASAILELSSMIVALESLNDKDSNVTINVGKISGGTASNVIAELAEASFEFRFWDGEAEKEVLKKIREIVDNPDNPECSARINCHHKRPAGCPVEGTEGLYDLVRKTADELGQRIGRERRGGTSDANFLMDEGIPTLDGMGPVGDLDHSLDEYSLKESLFERIELLALLLTRI